MQFQGLHYHARGIATITFGCCYNAKSAGSIQSTDAWQNEIYLLNNIFQLTVDIHTTIKVNKLKHMLLSFSGCLLF